MVMKRKIITVAAFILSTLFIESCQKYAESKEETIDHTTKNDKVISTKAKQPYPTTIWDVEMTVVDYLFDKNFISDKYISRDLTFRDIYG